VTEAAIIERYEPICRVAITGFFLPDADREDLLQEARVALLDAARCYRPDRGASFETFARFCIRRHLTDLIKGANRAKRLALTEALRVVRNEEGELAPVIELQPASSATDPQHRLETREEFERLKRGLALLSEGERRSVLGVAMGLSEAEIQESFANEPRLWRLSVDNALWRARRRLRFAA
jgi:RNA polymerase sporulation-specific sigma factor